MFSELDTEQKDFLESIRELVEEAQEKRLFVYVNTEETVTVPALSLPILARRMIRPIINYDDRIFGEEQVIAILLTNGEKMDYLEEFDDFDAGLISIEKEIQKRAEAEKEYFNYEKKKPITAKQLKQLSEDEQIKIKLQDAVDKKKVLNVTNYEFEDGKITGIRLINPPSGYNFIYTKGMPIAAKKNEENSRKNYDKFAEIYMEHFFE